LAFNDAELIGMADTAAILLNFLCEQLNVKREEVDAYVERKKAELATLRANMKAQEAGNERPNG
jgi:hypothetical protein